MVVGFANNGLHFPSGFAFRDLSPAPQWKQADQLIWPGNNINQHLPGRGIILQAVWENSHLKVTRLLNLCLSHSCRRVRCFGEPGSLIDENCGVNLARNHLVLLFCSVKAVLISLLSLCKHSLISLCDTRQRAVQLYKSYFYPQCLLYFIFGEILQTRMLILAILSNKSPGRFQPSFVAVSVYVCQ